jgi:DNA mismatch repair ATPase MutS
LQQRSDKDKVKSENAILINENEINSLTKYTNLYDDGSRFGNNGHFYSADLDVFGTPSLFGLINRARTFSGLQYLARWLSSPSAKEYIESRQEAIRELETDIDWRQKYANFLFNIRDHDVKDPALAIEDLLKQDLQWSTNSILTIYRRVVPFIWIALGLCYGSFPDQVYSLAILLALANMAITFIYSKRVKEVHESLSTALTKMNDYALALRHIMTRSYAAQYITDDVAFFNQGETNTSQPVAQLLQLNKISDLMDYRLNMFLGFVLNVLFLWDIRIVYLITKWQSLNQHTITKVFDLIGKMEALSSLSNWSFNHDHFAYPTFSEDTFELLAQDMGHPLLDMNINVHNDFQSTVKDHITIITGSNMSGKSTFLRTIGTNLLLAYAGTRVHARQLECSVVQIISYMRIKDALEESVSTFKAELNRIQLILEELEKNKNCLILIDEMLRGTNSRDKLKGSIGITKKLMSMEAYVMIATHDIKLAELGRTHPEQIKNYFFDIEFQDGDLKFDYKIKPGICENFNASFLISQLGIDMES